MLPGAGLSRVDLADPVTLQLDVNAAPERDAQLRIGVRLDDEWYGAGDLDVLGDGGHVVALWVADGDAWAVTLAALDTPPGPEVRRLLKRGDSVVVPAADRDDLVAEYLPRLHRHVPVVSSDGSVEVPEPAEPRLVLGGDLGGGRRGTGRLDVALPGRCRRPGLRACPRPAACAAYAVPSRSGRCWSGWRSTTSRPTTCAAGHERGMG